MDSLTPEQLKSSIARVTVTNRESGVVEELTVRPDSRCHFFERFCAGKYMVQLRLDWGDIDPHGHPRLDADLVDPLTGVHKMLNPAKSVHHTSSLGAENRSYDWQFEDAHLLLCVSVDWMVSRSVTGHGIASCTKRVFRADGTIEEHGQPAQLMGRKR